MSSNWNECFANKSGSYKSLVKLVVKLYLFYDLWVKQFSDSVYVCMFLCIYTEFQLCIAECTEQVQVVKVTGFDMKLMGSKYLQKCKRDGLIQVAKQQATRICSISRPCCLFSLFMSSTPPPSMINEGKVGKMQHVCSSCNSPFCLQQISGLASLLFLSFLPQGEKKEERKQKTGWLPIITFPNQIVFGFSQTA